jgi:hypothetical protein
VSLTLVLAAVDLAVGGFLLWYAGARQRGPKDPVLAVGICLLLIAVGLGVIDWRAHRAPTVVVQVPAPSGART